MPGPFDQGWRRIVVCASGPSVTAEQLAMIEAARADGVCRVLAICATAFALPNADAMYAADGSFWQQYGDRLKAQFRGQMWTRDKPSADRLGLRFVHAEKRDGLTKSPTAVNTGGNSGYSGINLAYLFGMVDGGLVGFDMRLGADDRTHHHGGHEGTLANPSADALKKWCGNFNHLARDLQRVGIRCRNATIDSALQCFDRVDLADVLQGWRAEALEPA